MANQSTIVVATNNPGKLKEFVLLLPNYKIISQNSLGITPDEELGETFFENSLQKARVANVASGMASLGDDSGLIVPALNNLPGLRSARYAHECATDEENRQHLKNELDKLENLSASNKKINFDQIIKLTNLSSQNSVSELIDFCLSKNKIKMIKILNENNFSEEDSILILRTLLSKTKRLFKLKKDQKMNNNLDNLILSYKPPIFWKEKDFVKQQIKLWKDFDIKKLISQINEVELLIKKTPINSKYILNNLLFETSSQN